MSRTAQLTAHVCLILVALLAGCAWLQQNTRAIPLHEETDPKHGRCLSFGFAITIPPVIVEQLAMTCTRPMDGGSFTPLDDAGSTDE